MLTSYFFNDRSFSLHPTGGASTERVIPACYKVAGSPVLDLAGYDAPRDYHVAEAVLVLKTAGGQLVTELPIKREGFHWSPKQPLAQPIERASIRYPPLPGGSGYAARIDLEMLLATDPNDGIPPLYHGINSATGNPVLGEVILAPGSSVRAVPSGASGTALGPSAAQLTVGATGVTELANPDANIEPATFIAQNWGASPVLLTWGAQGHAPAAADMEKGFAMAALNGSGLLEWQMSAPYPLSVYACVRAGGTSPQVSPADFRYAWSY